MPNVEVTTHNLYFHDQASIYSVDSKGSMIATSGGDNDVRIWEIERSAPKDQEFCYTNSLTSSVKIAYKHTLSAHQRAVNCVRFGDEYLASSSDSGHVLVWDISDFGKGLSHTVRSSDGVDVYEVAWHKSFLFVGQASGNISVYRVMKREANKENEGIANCGAAPVGEILSNSQGTCQMEIPGEHGTNESEKGTLVPGRAEGLQSKRAKIIKLDEGLLIDVKHIQTIKAHSDIVQGLSFNAFHSILATQSKDRTVKVFHFGEKLTTLAKHEAFNDKKFIVVGKSFFKRLSFAKSNLLFLTHCCLDDANVVFVSAYPFNDLHARIGPFDSTVQRVFEWGSNIAVLTKRSVYLINEKDGVYSTLFCVSNATFLPITDACVADGMLLISSLDGFVSTIRLS